MFIITVESWFHSRGTESWFHSRGTPVTHFPLPEFLTTSCRKRCSAVQCPRCRGMIWGFVPGSSLVGSPTGPYCTTISGCPAVRPAFGSLFLIRKGMFNWDVWCILSNSCVSACGLDWLSSRGRGFRHGVVIFV